MNKSFLILSVLCIFTIPYLYKENNQVITENVLKFAVIGDTHNRVEQMNAEIDYLNGEDIDFVIHQGDIVNTGSELKGLSGFYDRLNFPLVIVPGNHDSDFEMIPEKIHPRKWTEFKKYFGKYFRPLEVKGYYILPTGYGLQEVFEKKNMPTIIVSHAILTRNCDKVDNWEKIDKENIIIGFGGHSHNNCFLKDGGILIILQNYQEDWSIGAVTIYELLKSELKYYTYDTYNKKVLDEGIYKLK